MPAVGGVRRYWDSFCFIALLNDDEGADDCEKILDDAKEGKTQIIVSPVTQVEVIRPRGTPHPIPQEHKETIRAFFENDYIKWRNIDRRIADLARDLCWQHNVHPRDAMHLAVAIDTECDLVETFDGHLLTLTGQIKVKDALLTIAKPRWTGQLELLAKQEKG